MLIIDRAFFPSWGNGFEWYAINYGNTGGGYLQQTGELAIGSTFIRVARLNLTSRRIKGMRWHAQAAVVPSNRQLQFRINDVVTPLVADLIAGQSSGLVLTDVVVTPGDRFAISHTTGTPSAAVCNLIAGLIIG